MNQEFWRARRVFLTGHTGFKGSWLALWLQGLGAEVAGYSLAPPTTPNLYTLARVEQGMRSTTGDLRDAQRLSAALAEHRPEIVLHLAAQATVRPSYEDPISTLATNVLGTAQLLECVRRCDSVRAVVSVATDKCYENHEWLWGYRETESLGGHDPYSTSKACAELICASYRASFFPPAKYEQHGVALGSARAGNAIGGGDWGRDRLIPDIVAAFGAGRPVVIRAPHAVRPWQHVLEPLSGYLSLAERLVVDGPVFGEAWNFGPQDDDQRPVAWIVKAMAERWGEGAAWMVDDSPQPHEATTLRLDCTKARQRLGWLPRWRLPTAVDAVVDWYRAYADGADMGAVTRAQIAAWHAAASSDQ